MADPPRTIVARIDRPLEPSDTPSLLKPQSSSIPAVRTRVMGVLNLTPDSFSDGGLHATIDAAVRRADAMVAAGVDWIDVGGESTRPGSHRVDENEQIRRVVPTLAAVSRRGYRTLISIDTTRATVAAAALDAGASIVNDISAGLDDPALLPLVAARPAGVVLMHMQGTPATMQVNPLYSDVTREVIEFLLARAQFARTLGIDSADIWLDPGIGFGKSVEHNLQLLHDLPTLISKGFPVVVGVSRKGFIAKVTGETDPADRLFGTAGAVAWAAAAGADVVRVHDVVEMTRVVKMIDAIRGCRTSPVAGI